MNKKIVFALAAMLAVSILFTACGKKDEENKKPAQNQSGEVKADDNTEDEIKLELRFIIMLFIDTMNV